MQLVNLPAKFNIPFANGAVAPYIRDVPQNPTGTPGQASLQTGFPPENFSPVASGGVPPFGSDFNGLLNQATDWNRWQAAGVAFPPYDAAFQTAIGGYPHSALVSSLVEDMLIYYSLVDNNLTNPDAGGAGWFIWSRRLSTNKDLYVAPTGNDANNGLTPATAKKTIQAAVDTAWSFPPSQFTITIHVADGTYPENVETPTTPGPPVIITGNAGTPGNVIVNATSNAFQVSGPNALTVQNLRASVSGANSAIFSAINGGILTTINTESGAAPSSSWVFLGSSGTVLPGTHRFTASVGYMFAAYRGGNCALQAGSVFTIAGAITVTDSAIAVSNGSIEVPGASVPVFSNPGFVTGAKYVAQLNGVINTQGAGVNYFPGTVAGTTQTGGQYG
jgi:hypothetical protein